MFRLKDLFKTCDDNLQPYTMRAERHTEILDLHSGVDERGFSFRSVGNRYIFNTPELSEFELSMTYAYTFMEEYNPAFNILFGYDIKKRLGLGLRFEYCLGGGMTVSYINVDRMKISVKSQLTLPDFEAEEDKDVILNLKCGGGIVSGTIGNSSFAILIDDFCGAVGMERDNFIGELIVREYTLKSDEDFEEEIILPEQTVDIPLRDGGDIPYKFSYCIRKTENIYYLDTKLFGGTASRKLNREDRPGQYVAERDIMENAFVILRGDFGEKKFYIFNGSKVIVDPNIFWECLKRFFGHPEFPIEGRFVIDASVTDELKTISFGYDNLNCTGYSVQAGGPSEFVYDLTGTLLYSGDALGESIFELLSPKDKFAKTLIPEDAYNRNEIMYHLETNHYFHIDEEIDLTLSLKTKLNTEYFSVKAEIRDVYDSDTLASLEPVLNIANSSFGYSEIRAQIKSKPMDLGLYRIVFTVFYGEGIYRRFDKVFEVFDKDSSVSQVGS